MAKRRLMKEISTINTTDHPQYSISTNGDDLFHLIAFFKGPNGTPYEGGTFKVDIDIPVEYPHKAPSVHFITQIYHPNISSKGEICLEILKSGWSLTKKLNEILDQIYQVLQYPDPDDALCSDIASIFKADPESFNKKAREWTKSYAL